MRLETFTVGALSCPVDAYLPGRLTDRPNPALIIVPGGGYNHVSPREGEPVALRFLAHSVACFVLHYPVGDAIASERPLDTLTQLVERLVERADELAIDKDRMAILGFSAGAHLAASYGTLRKGRHLKAMLLGYPVITSGQFAHRGSFDKLCQSGEERSMYSLEDQVDAQTPPTFIFHTADDATVPVENSLLFAMALSKAKVPFSMHIYPSGIHGSSIGTESVGTPNAQLAGWVDEALTWLFGIWDFRE